MATHNQVRLVGFLLEDPVLLNSGVSGAEKVMCKIRTVHRDFDGYFGMHFQDVIVFEDNPLYLKKMQKLQRFDLIDIKGVYNVLTLTKHSKCPYCGTKNSKPGSSAAFVYPIWMSKVNATREAYEHDKNLPATILETHYGEVSNQVLMIGTVVNEPSLIENGHQVCCKYQLGIDRKFYIKTQDNLTADYPWIYSYGKQARMDAERLKVGSVVLVDGFVQNRSIKNKGVCSSCGKEYAYPDVAMEIVAYSVEYFENYKRDEDEDDE